MRQPTLDERSIGMYEERLMTLQMIGDEYGVSRQAVLKYLRKHGVDTSDRLRDVKCVQCGKEMKRTRKRARVTKRPCCSPACYKELIKNPNYQDSRQGCRIAHRVIEEYVCPPENYISHHVDGDEFNNEKGNLWVFRTNADHMRYHRGGESEALIVSKNEWVKVSLCSA